MTVALPLFPVDFAIMSCYDSKGKTGGPRTELRALRTRDAGLTAPDVTAALTKLHESVMAAGGDFRVTDCHREVSVQIALRKRYDTWVAAGKPTGAKYNPKTMKSAFVAMPGKSNHNGGRAIDVDLASLKFPGLPADKQLDKLWEIAKPLGWSPIIKAPTEGASESWHFDFWGDLEGVYSRLGYEQAALCGALLVGQAGDWQTYERTIQALVCRAGAAIGEIDGAIGNKTRGALVKLLGLPEATVVARLSSKDTTLFATLIALPAC